ncbi:serine/threonine-protein phosphatase 1 regulatory subunit 10-like isoform X2 [Plodia interpunctella]|nr:serine/threonine-protein phosphatase 1 regulatory subunit 10-like isoform X2 [Plodia interpunctella]
MTKFSKKLVSKCIYIQILKCTDTEILRLFMGSGGWLLVHMWLTESIVAKNWPLVRELLELLLLCPVDIERLKTNNCPKLVKELSKDGNHFAIRALASKLVEQWLKTVKGEQVLPIQLTEIAQIISESDHDSSNLISSAIVKEEEHTDFQEKRDEVVESKEIDISKDCNNMSDCEVNLSKEVDKPKEEEALPVLKITLKDGKQIISQVDDSNSKLTEESTNTEKSKDKHKSKSKEKSHDKSSSRSSSSKHSKSHDSSNKSSNSSSNHKSSSSRHSSKDKSRDKDKSSSHSSKSKTESSSRKSSDKLNTSSSKSKDDRSKHTSSDKTKYKEKDKKTDKNKDDSQKPTIEKLESEKSETPSIQKLGKIPKLSDIKKEKPSISIEVRKPDEPKPKTVKTFNSKFRKHGLEEEVKPPPSRAAILSKKAAPVLPPTMPIPKRPSPVHNETPPEKKPKTVEILEKPGAIKLIPPKPKPMMLLESDMFMDALNASATNKKEPKKRKRRTSGSKDGNAPDGSPPSTPTTMTSPSSENKSVPPRFYQDTLETEENKDKPTEQGSESNEIVDTSINSDKENIEQMDTSEPHTVTINGLKGVLCYHKRKGPKKSIKWKPDCELEEIQYFELDETERVNVTKPFTDMKYLERIHEREAFQKGRNISNDDVMEEKTSWRPLIPIDTEGQLQVEYGKNSKEKEIQAIRQKGTLQPLYFHKSMIPDSPLEADPETHPYTEPTIIPLDDATGNQDNISDFRNMPWPEPKGNAPPASSTMNIQPIFPPNITQFPNNFPNAQFPVVPGFQGPNMVSNEWPNGVSPNMMPPMPPTQLPPVMPPGMIMPPDNMMMGPDMFGAPNPMFPGPPDAFNMQPNMFPVDFNMPVGPQGPPGPDGFAGQGNFRGAIRGRGSSGHWRGKNSGNWEGPNRGRGAHSRGGRKNVCIYFQRKGSCRQGDNCSFLHPGVNCPY